MLVGHILAVRAFFPGGRALRLARAQRVSGTNVTREWKATTPPFARLDSPRRELAPWPRRESQLPNEYDAHCAL